MTVAKLRVLADRAARGEPDREAERKTLATQFHKGVTTQIDGPKAAPAPSPTAQNTIATLRAQQATALQKGGRYSAEFKAVSAKLTAAYAATYPGEHPAS